MKLIRPRHGAVWGEVDTNPTLSQKAIKDKVLLPNLVVQYKKDAKKVDFFSCAQCLHQAKVHSAVRMQTL